MPRENGTDQVVVVGALSAPGEQECTGLVKLRAVGKEGVVRYFVFLNGTKSLGVPGGSGVWWIEGRPEKEGKPGDVNVRKHSCKKCHGKLFFIMLLLLFVSGRI